MKRHHDLSPRCFVIVLRCPAAFLLEDSLCQSGVEGVPTHKLPWWLSSSFKLIWRWAFSLKQRIWACVKSPQGSQHSLKNPLMTVAVRRASRCRGPATHSSPMGICGRSMWPLKLVPAWAFQWTLWYPGIWAAMDMSACCPKGVDSLESLPPMERSRKKRIKERECTAS